jgi:hypothetical protein
MQSENVEETAERKEKKQINNRKKSKIKGKTKKIGKNIMKSLFLSRLHICIFFQRTDSPLNVAYVDQKTL